MLVAPSSVPSALVPPAPLSSIESGTSQSGAVVPSGLLNALAGVPDPRNPRGVGFRLATLLAVGVCAVTSARHNSLTAIAEWVRRCDQDVLAPSACAERSAHREEVREVKVVSVGGLLFPHARQVVRIHRSGREPRQRGLRVRVCATLHHSGWADIASGRRAHTHPAAGPHPPRDSVIKLGECDSPRGLCR
ncbi:transposase family protein [Streptomyces sp. NPDC051940]|uniref:transposase family protein n=1 Tax=Streptomyces sp. NPDC051940 TaxID=3155675 RepID=UPI003448ACD4